MKVKVPGFHSVVALWAQMRSQWFLEKAASKWLLFDGTDPKGQGLDPTRWPNFRHLLEALSFLFV